MGLVQVLSLPALRRPAATPVAPVAAGTGAASAAGTGAASRADGDEPVVTVAPQEGEVPQAPPQNPNPTPEVVPQAPPLATSTAPVSEGGGLLDMLSGKTEFERVRAEIVVLQASLRSHSQAAKIAKPLSDIAAKIGAADVKATAEKWTDGTKLLEEARVLCTDGKKLADDWAEYAKLRASAAGQRESLKGFFSVATLNSYDTTIAAADNDVNTNTPPAFAAAKLKLKTIDDVVRPMLKREVQEQRDKLTRIESQSAAVKAFAAKPIADAKVLIDQSEAAINAASWAEVIRTKNVAARILGPTERLCTRRTEYDGKRAPVKAAVDVVRNAPATQPMAAALDRELAAADRLVGSSRVDLQACKLEYSIVSPK